jgi:hypothetical protein
MTSDADAQSIAPELLPHLLAALPNKLLLGVIKSDRRFAQLVFQGFAARVQSLALPAVRGRLERELPKFPQVIEALLTCWQESFTPLIAILASEAFMPTPENLAPLVATYGDTAVRYALLDTEREALHAWADRLSELPTPEAQTLVPEPAHDTARIVELRRQLVTLEERVRELQQALQRATQEREAANHAKVGLEHRLKTAVEMEATLRKQADSLDAQLDRERRRAKRAEEEADDLRKQLRERQTAPPPAATPDPSAMIAEAVALLQQGLHNLQGAAPPPAAPPSKPPPAKPAAPVRKSAPPEASVVLPGTRGTRTYPLAAVLGALQRNDTATVEKVRDGIARLADQPAKERDALQRLATVGIPAAVLTGPLRAAVVDGSNVANMSHAARGKLAYLDQIRRSAWTEGYFPILIIVDASLRYQIDQPEQLMRMVEDGLITMTDPGTPADPLLIREAQARNAVLITNDRMEEWPDAKTVDRRKASMSHNTVRVGSFHTSTHTWFQR